jgi:NAD(P) transhydrogenase
MTPPLSFDILVIGSGPGGQKAAVQGAKAGKRVAMVERERELGGSCVYQGTIPSKTLRESALAIMHLKRCAAALKVTLREDLEVASLMTRLHEVLKAHHEFISEHLSANGIVRFHGRGSFSGPGEVTVEAVDGTLTRLKAETIVIASGSRPRTPRDIPIDHEHILDSDSILSMIYLPRSLTVLGGGVIACEYASIFSLLGVRVTMIDKAPRPLGFMDPELTGKFVDHFQRFGGRFIGEGQVRSVVWNGSSQVITELESGETILSDKMLVAQGRSANVEGLGLEEAGIQLTDRGLIAVDANYRTSQPNVYAVGDVIGPPALAACSMEQGRRAICHALGMNPGHAFEAVPVGIYSVPEMASVGLTEEQARQKFGDVLVGRARFDEIARGQIAGIQDGLLKIVADADGKKILGVQIVGDGATDLVHLGQFAILNGNEVTIFLENIMNFPTLGEAYRVAALNLLNTPRRRARQFEEPVVARAC